MSVLVPFHNPSSLEFIQQPFPVYLLCAGPIRATEIIKVQYLPMRHSQFDKRGKYKNIIIGLPCWRSG